MHQEQAPQSPQDTWHRARHHPERVAKQRKFRAKKATQKGQARQDAQQARQEISRTNRDQSPQTAAGAPRAQARAARSAERQKGHKTTSARSDLKQAKDANTPEATTKRREPPEQKTNRRGQAATEPKCTQRRNRNWGRHRCWRWCRRRRQSRCPGAARTLDINASCCGSERLWVL